MRYPASEKLEIINLVAQSKLSVRRTLEHLGVSRATFYRWCDQYQSGGPKGLCDRPSKPDRVWNRIPDAIRTEIIDLALAEPALSPRELAVRFIDTKGYFVSEASVYRLLKAHDLITSPAFIVIKAAEEFHTKTTAPNQLWQTDFTYRPSSTISRATSSPGNSASPCASTTSPKRWSWRCRPQAAIRSASGTGRGCCPTTAPAMSPKTSPSGWENETLITSAARPAIPRRKAKSSAGIRR